MKTFANFLVPRAGLEPALRSPFPFTRVTRRVVQSEDYGDTGGDLSVRGLGHFRARARLSSFANCSNAPRAPSWMLHRRILASETRCATAIRTATRRL